MPPRATQTLLNNNPHISYTYIYIRVCTSRIRDDCNNVHVVYRVGYIGMYTRRTQITTSTTAGHHRPLRVFPFSSNHSHVPCRSVNSFLVFAFCEQCSRSDSLRTRYYFAFFVSTRAFKSNSIQNYVHFSYRIYILINSDE